MKDPAHPHVDPHHADSAHPHVRTTEADPAMRKTALFGIVGAVVVVGVVFAVMSSAVKEVAVKNAGSVDVRVEYAWKENGNRVARDRQVAPGNSISFGLQPDSELVVYHPAPDEQARWMVIPVGESDRKFEIVPKNGGALTASHDGQPVAANPIPVPDVKR